MTDTKTLDSLTLLQFKDYEAKERWCNLVKSLYLYDFDTEITMNFARRWAKIMQYLVTHDNRIFEDIVVTSAQEANIDNLVKKSHAEKAIELLVEIWLYGDILQDYADNGGRNSIINLF